MSAARISTGPRWTVSSISPLESYVAGRMSVPGAASGRVLRTVAVGSGEHVLAVQTMDLLVEKTTNRVFVAHLSSGSGAGLYPALALSCILQLRKPIALEGAQDGPGVLAREVQARVDTRCPAPARCCRADAGGRAAVLPGSSA